MDSTHLGAFREGAEGYDSATKGTLSDIGGVWEFILVAATVPLHP